MKLGFSRIVAMLVATCGPLVLIDGCSAAPPPPLPPPPPDRQHVFTNCEEFVVAPTEDGGVDVRGRPCAKESDCSGGFCDRGLCAWPTTGWFYGLPCGHGERFYRGDAGHHACAGYLCLAGLCRSCESDAECHRWAGPDTTCMPFANWPGKQCGTIDPVRVCPNGNSVEPDWWVEPGMGIRPPGFETKPAP